MFEKEHQEVMDEICESNILELRGEFRADLWKVETYQWWFSFFHWLNKQLMEFGERWSIGWSHFEK
jgi:hypothetical protein